MKLTLRVVFYITLLLANSEAFSPRIVTQRPASQVFSGTRLVRLRAEEVPEEDRFGQGDLYETDSDKEIRERADNVLSDGMKAKLKNELRGQGADPNSSFNPYPILFVGIAGLVVLGGAVIFY